MFSCLQNHHETRKIAPRTPQIRPQIPQIRPANNQKRIKAHQHCLGIAPRQFGLLPRRPAAPLFQGGRSDRPGLTGSFLMRSGSPFRLVLAGFSPFFITIKSRNLLIHLYLIMASTTTTNFADHLKIPLHDVLEATNNFDRNNIIGHGGLGVAYKGQLSRSRELLKIAALRLHHNQGKDVEFWTEISVLSDLKHTNLVSVIAFCDEKNEKIIVFTRAAKGSLKEHLDSSNLTWTQRLRICLGMARAMSYLHHEEGRDYGVIHRNINSTTVLLDDNWEAKLSGFKVYIKQSANRITDQVILADPVGTIGYMDPQIETTGGVTHKSDIYAFGVVLFEVVCGRRAYIKDDANMFLTQLVKQDARYSPSFYNESIHVIKFAYQILVSSIFLLRGRAGIPPRCEKDC